MTRPDDPAPGEDAGFVRVDQGVAAGDVQVVFEDEKAWQRYREDAGRPGPAAG
jgi:hypothetical protein